MSRRHVGRSRRRGTAGLSSDRLREGNLRFLQCPQLVQSLAPPAVQSSLRCIDKGHIAVHRGMTDVPQEHTQLYNPIDAAKKHRVLGACVSLVQTSWCRSFHLASLRVSSSSRAPDRSANSCKHVVAAESQNAHAAFNAHLKWCG